MAACFPSIPLGHGVPHLELASAQLVPQRIEFALAAGMDVGVTTEPMPTAFSHSLYSATRSAFVAESAGMTT